MAWQGQPDPMEQVIERGLEAAGIPYRRTDDNPRRLDFYLPTLDIYIEVKRFHTPRIADQMSRVPDIIVIQGMKAAVTFVKMIVGYSAKSTKFKRPRYDDLVDWNCNGHADHT
jgi:hypothetical protein